MSLRTSLPAQLLSLGSGERLRLRGEPWMSSDEQCCTQSLRIATTVWMSPLGNFTSQSKRVDSIRAWCLCKNTHRGCPSRERYPLEYGIMGRGGRHHNHKIQRTGVGWGSWLMCPELCIQPCSLLAGGMKSLSKFTVNGQCSQ